MKKTLISILPATLLATLPAQATELDNTQISNPVNLVTNVGGAASSDTKCLNGNTSSFGVAKAFDGSYYSDGTRWIGHGDTFPQRAVWTFPQPTVVDAVRLYNANSSGAAQSPSAFTVSGSNDGENWTTLDTESNVTGWTANQFRTFGFENTTAYSKYRLEVTEVQGPGLQRMTITEIEFYRLTAASFEISAGDEQTVGTDTFSTDFSLVVGGTAEAGIVWSTAEDFATASTNVVGAALDTGDHTAAITGLAPATTYWWKLYAKSGADSVETWPASFTTGGNPVLGDATASPDGDTVVFAISLAKAALENTAQTSVSVFYGTDGENWTEHVLGSASSSQTWTATVSGLDLGATYLWYVRAAATLESGRVLETVSATDTFATLFSGDLYVAAGNEAAAQPYSTPETAATDIATALAIAGDGATVHVAPGLYPIPSSLYVTNAVKVVGEGGNPSAVVVSNRVASGWSNQKQRVFVIGNAGALVANLTMQKGEAYGEKQDGGNFHVLAAGGTVSNCVVEAGLARDNSVAAGGYLENGTVTHTVFRKNNSRTNSRSWYDNQAGVLHLKGSAKAENCLFVENDQSAAVVLINVYDTAVMRNCTIVDTSLAETNEYCRSWSALNIGSAATVQNVVVAGVTNAVDGAAVGPTGAIARFAPGALDADATDFPEGTVVGTASVFFRNAAGGDFRPSPDGPLANAGVNYGSMADVDLAGDPRRVGSCIDIGCYEAPDAGTVIVFR